MKARLKWILTAILIGSLCSNGFAQELPIHSSEAAKKIDRNFLKGRISDAVTGMPLVGASIYITDLKLGVTSDKDGLYLIRNIAAGQHLIEVSYIGYASLVESVEVNGEVERNFALSTTVAENEGITVTGVSTATQVKKTPIPVSIVRRETLLKGSATNIIDALSKVPGVAQISTGPAISKPSIRGLGYNRVVVVNDGVRQEGQQWGDEHGIEIDEYSVNKAEVLKGPASIMYGSDALAGVINIISMIPAPESTIKGNFLANYQTNNNLRGFHGDIGGNHNGFIWGLYGSYKAAADYQNKYDGRVFNSKYNEKDFGAYVGLNRQWGFSHILFSNFDQHLGLIEGDRDDATGKFLKLVNNNGTEEEAIADGNDFTTTDPFIPRQRIQHLKITSDNSFNLSKNRLTVNLGYQRNQRQEFGNVLDESEKELFFDLNTVNYNVQLHLDEHKGWKTSFGINGMQQNNKNKGVEELIPEYSLFDVGAFVYTRKTLDKLTLSGGLRFDNRHIDSRELIVDNEVKFQQFTKNFGNISASAGLSYQASKAIVLKLNLARGFRAPSIPELASNGAHEGTSRYEYGEQDLKSETSYQIDGGMEINSEHISFDLNLFYNSVQNFIYYRKLSSANGGDSIIVDGSEEFLAFRFDQENAKLYGGEFVFDIHPHPLDWLHFENTFSYVRGQLSQEQDGSKNLPFIPAGRLINELRGDFLKQGKVFRNFYVRLELDNTFKQSNPFTGYNTETATPGYSLLNAGLGSDILFNGKTAFSIYVTANNLTDVAYQNHLSRLKYAPENLVTGRLGVFNLGRNFSFKVNVPIR